MYPFSMLPLTEWKDRMVTKMTVTWEKYVAWRAMMSIILKNDKRGWIVCLAVLVITVIRSSITYSFGVFVVKLEDLWKRPLAEENWIGTLSFCISLSCAPVSVAFIRTLRHRGYRWSGLIGTLILAASCLGSSFVPNLEWMFFTHSLLYGVGSSLIYMASSLLIGEYFDKDHKYHVLATSILLCGYPIGSLIFNPVNAALVTKFGWRVAFRVASGLILIFGIICCWAFSSKEDVAMERLQEENDDDDVVIPTPPPAPIPPPVEEEILEDEAESHPGESKFHRAGRNFLHASAAKFPRRCCTLSEVKERPEIVLWYIGNGLSYLGFFMPFLNLPYYMKLHDIQPTRSSWVLTLLSLAECVTYIIASFLGDYLKNRLVYVNVVAAAALSIICMIWPFVDINYSLICLIALAMGGFLGLTIVYTYAASGEVTQLPIDIAWSFTNLWSGMGILVGPFFSGAIFDIRKSYDDVFFVVGALYMINTFIFALIPYFGWRRRRKQQESESYTEIHGMVATNYRETYKISSMRSLSKGSLANGDADGVPEYGATTQETKTTPAEPPAANGQPWTADWQQQEHAGQGGYQNHAPLAPQCGWPPADKQQKTWPPQNWQ
ncbi:hypothetical protein CAPTEDRAFT_218721 [Capitella teleta]|uniref:Major facilitator superfamily (MFS) profile domain-containing protein n=1 Tax=Capitella teleta TaxID=283909 RepID=X2ANP7_CAPTE|nr:hypothetical protein CAPTEDRAFT_218721 [Capitella teleta]|eukprot:ELT90070.1 hypothetical protein CAPTEDRAFT_218721 [Capitella teleta]